MPYIIIIISYREPLLHHSSKHKAFIARGVGTTTAGVGKWGSMMLPWQIEPGYSTLYSITKSWAFSKEGPQHIMY